MNFNFYIPKNVTTRFEIVKGVGFREMIYVGIATILGVILAVIINSTTNNFLLAAVVVAVCGGGTFIFNMKDKNNQSVIMLIRDVIRFNRSQKFYKYELKEVAYGVYDYESEK